MWIRTGRKWCRLPCSWHFSTWAKNSWPYSRKSAMLHVLSEHTFREYCLCRIYCYWLCKPMSSQIKSNLEEIWPSVWKFWHCMMNGWTDNQVHTHTFHSLALSDFIGGKKIHSHTTKLHSQLRFKGNIILSRLSWEVSDFQPSTPGSSPTWSDSVCFLQTLMLL